MRNSTTTLTKVTLQIFLTLICAEFALSKTTKELKQPDEWMSFIKLEDGSRFALELSGYSGINLGASNGAFDFHVEFAYWEPKVAYDSPTVHVTTDKANVNEYAALVAKGKSTDDQWYSLIAWFPRIGIESFSFEKVGAFKIEKHRNWFRRDLVVEKSNIKPQDERMPWSQSSWYRFECENAKYRQHENGQIILYKKSSPEEARFLRVDEINVNKTGDDEAEMKVTFFDTQEEVALNLVISLSANRYGVYRAQSVDFDSSSPFYQSFGTECNGTGGYDLEGWSTLFTR